MALNGLGERKLLTRTIKEKYKTPKEIDKGAKEKHTLQSYANMELRN